MPSATFRGEKAAEAAHGMLTADDRLDGATHVELEVELPDTDDATTTSVETSGEGAIERARDAMAGFDNLNQSKFIHFDYETGSPEEESELAVDGGKQTQHDGLSKYPVPSEPNDERELKRIKPGTEHAKVLQGVYQHDGYVTWNALKDKLSVNGDSASSALTTMFRRKLVERRKTEPGGQYEYQVTAYGWSMLREHDEAKT